ncbi:helix-turn-helix domain-containing protein [Streptomyces sp. NPDC001902]
MASEVSPPPMAWRYCGNQVKLWREHAGVTREQLADEAGYGYETVKSMEQGRRRPTQRLLQIADGLCGAQGKLTAAEAFLKPERFLSYARDFMRYEAEAIALNTYEPQFIPGLLQTEETALALFRAHWPPLDDETIEERVAARMARQALLDKQTRAFSFTIGEAALRYPVGGGEAHVRQLERLLEAGARRNVDIQAMPFGGAHPGLNGPFVLLETAEHLHLAYVEGHETGVLHSDSEKVSIIAQRHAMILRRALGPEESEAYIGKLAEELRP